MRVSEFDYELPDELIAQEPLAERDRSRMLVVDRANQSWRDSSFAEFPTFLNAGDVIVINNTRVFPARLIGHRIVNAAKAEQEGSRFIGGDRRRENDQQPLDWRRGVRSPGSPT